MKTSKVKSLEKAILSAAVLSPFLIHADSSSFDPVHEMSPSVQMERIDLNSQFQVGANYTYLTLKPKGQSSFHGSLGGMQATYEYRPMNRFYGAGTFSWKEGSTHGSSGDRSILYLDIQEKMGYTFAFERAQPPQKIYVDTVPSKRNILFTLFSGFAYRYTEEKYSPDSGNSLCFFYNEFYFPVGFLGDFGITSWFSLGLDFTWMPQVFPTVSISPMKGTHWNLSYQLANFLVQLPFTFSLTESKRFLLTFTPSYQRWQDGHSTAELANGTSLGLPKNTYNYYGADLNFSYCF